MNNLFLIVIILNPFSSFSIFLRRSHFTYALIFIKIQFTESATKSVQLYKARMFM